MVHALLWTLSHSGFETFNHLIQFKPYSHGACFKSKVLFVFSNLVKGFH